MFTTTLRSLQGTLSVDHCGDDNRFGLQSINDTIVVPNDFADIFVVELRHLSAQMREARQFLNLIHDILNDRRSVSGRI